MEKAHLPHPQPNTGPSPATPNTTSRPVTALTQSTAGCRKTYSHHNKRTCSNISPSDRRMHNTIHRREPDRAQKAETTDTYRNLRSVTGTHLPDRPTDRPTDRRMSGRRPPAANSGPETGANPTHPRIHHFFCAAIISHELRTRHTPQRKQQALGRGARTAHIRMIAPFWCSYEEERPRNTVEESAPHHIFARNKSQTS